ncbi:hypothetical protein ANN_12323 [Periplaneta americana]|uniref:Uncharacterized protein n=1 Tax=Periplaneta americana TaxID=6978 RepID=A0ABQ8TIH4_PERAM|nr:hypothetical protein ANN_12323 [Periplaneta americana]
MNPGSSTESYPAFARIRLRENPGKNLNQVICPDRDSNPGHLDDELRVKIADLIIGYRHEGLKLDSVKIQMFNLHYSFFTYTTLALNGSNEGDNAGEMSPGSSTESYPAFARIGLRENPGNNLNQVTCPDRDLNPGHLVSRPDALTVTPQIISRSMSTFVSRKKSILSRLRTAHNLRSIAQGLIDWTLQLVQSICPSEMEEYMKAE